MSEELVALYAPRTSQKQVSGTSGFPVINPQVTSNILINSAQSPNRLISPLATLSLPETPIVRSTPKFHPKFPLPTILKPAHVILRSSDNICFCASINLLAVHSGFFRELRSLPRAAQASRVTSVANREKRSIHLESATSFTIKVFLSLISAPRDVGWLRDVANKSHPLAFYDLLNGVYKAVEVYELHSLPRLLCDALTEDPFFHFALAAISQNEKLAKRIAKDRLETLQMGDMGITARKLLEDLASSHLKRLTRFYDRRSSAHSDLVREILTGCSPWYRFPNRCRKNRGCASYREVDGQFERLYIHAAKTAVASIEVGTPPQNLGRRVQEGLSRTVKCPYCLDRMVELFHRDIRRYLARLRDLQL